jgi:hypothetical protein
MGWTINLEDEQGKVIQTLQNELHYDELGDVNLDGFILIKYIDFYGDTTFNTLQLDDLMSDLEKLKTILKAQIVTIQETIDLVKSSKSQVHTYIKFYGD